MSCWVRWVGTGCVGLDPNVPTILPLERSLKLTDSGSEKSGRSGVIRREWLITPAATKRKKDGCWWR